MRHGKSCAEGLGSRRKLLCLGGREASFFGDKLDLTRIIEEESLNFLVKLGSKRSPLTPAEDLEG